MKDIKSVLTMLVSKRMRPILLQICWTGVSISVYTGLIVPIVFNSLPTSTIAADFNANFKSAMMVMCGLGVGEIVGGIGMGIIVDKIGAKKSSLINVLLILI